jgi:hypothetical protein
MVYGSPSNSLGMRRYIFFVRQPNQKIEVSSTNFWQQNYYKYNIEFFTFSVTNEDIKSEVRSRCWGVFLVYNRTLMDSLKVFVILMVCYKDVMFP